MRPTLSFRTRTSRVIAVAGWALCAVVAVAMLAEGRWGWLPWPALAALVLHLVWWRPRVEVADGGITVLDLLRDVHVPWTAVRGFASRWAFAVRTVGGEVTSWAIPAASGTASALARRRGADDAEALADPDEPVLSGAGDVPTLSRSGTADDVERAARARQASLRAAGHLTDDLAPGRVEETWRILPWVGVAGLLVTALVLR